MEYEKIDLDKTDFDFLIFGTDFSESILAAVASSHGHSCASVDCDFLYSGTLKAMNLREYAKWKNLTESKFKDHLVRNIETQFFTEDYSTLEEFSDKVGFRNIYIDLDPKFLLSSSPSTQELIQIGIDNYTTFKSVRKLMFYTKDQFDNIPITKTQIIKAKFLNLKEKKNDVVFG